MNLEEKIKLEIKNNGYIPIDRFMEIALLDEQQGYYTSKNPIGKDSDFITSPEISVLFGEILGAFIVNQIEQNLNNYNKINIIELGSGKGTLLSDILNLLFKFPNIYQKINIKILDINKPLVEIQKQTLKNHIDKIEWFGSLDQIDTLSPHIYIANEFFDALPVKQFVKRNGAIKERIIKLDENSDFIFDDIEAQNIPEIITADEDDYDNGNIIEYSPLSVLFMEKISKSIFNNKGFAIIIDYGHANIVSGDTLQSIYKHKFNNVFENIGTADLTYHVNFRTLYNTALNCGLKNIYFNNQSEFLKSMGIIQRAEKLSQKMTESEKIDLFSRANRLIDLEQMGDLFKILVAENF